MALRLRPLQALGWFLVMPSKLDFATFATVGLTIASGHLHCRGIQHSGAAPRATRRERAPPVTPRRAKDESSHRREAASGRNAAVRATARRCRRDGCERGAAGSGAARAARRRPPMDMTQPRRGSHTENAHRRSNAAQSQGQEQPPRSSGGWAQCGRACGGTTVPTRQLRARRRRQRHRESRATATAQGHDATTPRATRREHAPPVTPRRAKGKNSRRGAAAAGRDAAVRAAARRR